jgi:hypothetical protein
MYPRYKGPMVVIRRTRGGSYIVAEMDGTVLKTKIGAFRVLPHRARYEPIELPKDIHDLIDLTRDQLDRMVKDEEVKAVRSLQNSGDPVFDKIPNLRLPAEGNGNERYEGTDLSSDSGDEESGDDPANNSDDEGVSRTRTRAMRARK